MFRPKFKLICRSYGNTDDKVLVFMLTNVSSVITSNLHVESFEVIFHDGSRYKISQTKMAFPTSLGKNEVREFSCDNKVLTNWHDGYKTLQLVFCCEDEGLNRFRCVATKNVETSRYYALGEWNTEVELDNEHLYTATKNDEGSPNKALGEWNTVVELDKDHLYTATKNEEGLQNKALGEWNTAVELDKEHLHKDANAVKPTVFISYNWGSERTADEVEERLAPCANVLRDKRSIKPWGSIKKFMKKIRETDLVTVIVSDKYLQSVNCLYEIMELLKDDDWATHSMFIVEDSAKDIYKAIGQLKYINYWRKEENSLEEALKGLNPAEVTVQAEELRKIKLILLNLNDFLKRVTDSNNPEKDVAIDNIVARIGMVEKEHEVEKRIEDPGPKHIVEIKHKIEKAIVDKTWVKTPKDRLRILHDRTSQFKCNNLILRDSNIRNPDINNGLIKVEPYDFSDDGIIVIVPRGGMRKWIKVKDRGEMEVAVCSEILFQDIDEIDPNGSKNYPYPTLFCRFHGSNPFNRDVYYDIITGYEVEEDKGGH